MLYLKSPLESIWRTSFFVHQRSLDVDLMSEKYLSITFGTCSTLVKYLWH